MSWKSGEIIGSGPVVGSFNPNSDMGTTKGTKNTNREEVATMQLIGNLISLHWLDCNRGELVTQGGRQSGLGGRGAHRPGADVRRDRQKVASNVSVSTNVSSRGVSERLSDSRSGSWTQPFAAGGGRGVGRAFGCKLATRQRCESGPTNRLPHCKDVR